MSKTSNRQHRWKLDVLPVACVSSVVRRGAVALIAMVVVVLGIASNVQAHDYDPQSSDWNGLQELIRVAQEAGVELHTAPVLDWQKIRRNDGLLIVYPRTTIDLGDVSAFLEDGGRLALLDDFGDAGPLLRWFQIHRSEEARGQSRSPELPGLLLAWRQGEHPLAEGVDSLTTNEPAVVFHPRLSPVFALSEDPRQGIVLAGQVGRGRLVVGSDPSVLINTMMRFPGNRQFARNLLLYLAGGPGGRVHLVYSGFRVRGVYQSRTQPKTPVRQLVRSVDDALALLSTLAGDVTAVRALALLLVLVSVLGLALKTWGTRPSDRFGPTGPAGVAASTAEKVDLFTRPRANMLYPALIAKRYFERSLLRAVGLRPPTDVGAVLAAARGRLDQAQQTALRNLLVELDALSAPPHEGGPSRLTVRRFLSLWRRIGAILTALGDK